MTVHHFVLIYQDDEDGRLSARCAVDRWFCQHLLQIPVWHAFYDRIDLGSTGDDRVLLAAVVDGTGELVEV